MRALIVTMLLGAVACTSTSSASSDSELVAIAREGFRAAEHASLHPVVENRYPVARRIGNVVDEASGLRRLHHVDPSPSCITGTRSVYALADDVDALWQKMRAAADTIRGGTATVNGRRVRVLIEGGFDYNITVALIDGDAHDPDLLVIDGCG